MIWGGSRHLQKEKNEGLRKPTKRGGGQHSPEADEYFCRIRRGRRGTKGGKRQGHHPQINRAGNRVGRGGGGGGKGNEGWSGRIGWRGEKSGGGAGRARVLSCTVIQERNGGWV